MFYSLHTEHEIRNSVMADLFLIRSTKNMEMEKNNAAIQ